MDLTQKLTLTMSACALLISSLVAWQTYRSSRVNEATNRAIITVDSARMTTVPKLGGGEILLTLENSGKAVARNVRVKYFVGVILPKNAPEPSSSWTYPDKPVEHDNNAPGKKETQTVTYELPNDKDLFKGSQPTMVSLFFGIRYIDEGTDREYTERQGYSGFLSGKAVATPEMFPGILPTMSLIEQSFGPQSRGRSAQSK